MSGHYDMGIIIRTLLCLQVVIHTDVLGGWLWKILEVLRPFELIPELLNELWWRHQDEVVDVDTEE